MLVVEFGDSDLGVNTLCLSGTDSLFKLRLCKLLLLLLICARLHNALDSLIILINCGQVKIYLGLEFGLGYFVDGFFNQQTVFFRHGLFAGYVHSQCNSRTGIRVNGNTTLRSGFGTTAKNGTAGCRYAYQHQKAQKQTYQSFIHNCGSSLKGRAPLRALFVLYFTPKNEYCQVDLSAAFVNYMLRGSDRTLDVGFSCA